MSRLEKVIRYYARNPVDFVEDIIGAKPDDNQKAILRSVEAEPMTSVRSGHGVGKSAVESWAIIWFRCTRPYPKEAVIPSVQAFAEEHSLTRESFHEFVGGIARRDWQARQIMLPSVVIAQASIESAVGKSELAVNANALFGIKLNGWTGRVYVKDAKE